MTQRTLPNQPLSFNNHCWDFVWALLWCCCIQVWARFVCDDPAVDEVSGQCWGLRQCCRGKTSSYHNCPLLPVNPPSIQLDTSYIQVVKPSLLVTMISLSTSTSNIHNFSNVLSIEPAMRASIMLHTTTKKFTPSMSLTATSNQPSDAIILIIKMYCPLVRVCYPPIYPAGYLPISK